MGVIRGRAVLLWTDADDQNTDRVLILREPLRELRPAHNQSVFADDSLDKTQRQVFTIGEGVDEFLGRIRYQDDRQGTIDLLKAGTKLRTITYYPDTGDPGRAFSCYLISPLSPSQAGMDQDRGVDYGELEIEIRLRRTGGTPFDGAWQKDVLFAYRAGGRIEEATFARAGVGSYAAISGGGGFGKLSTAAAGLARTHWMSTNSSVDPRTRPAMLLESTAANRLKKTELLKASSVWSVATVTLTSAQTDPRGGSNAWLVADTSTTVQQSLAQFPTVTVSTKVVLSWWVKQGTSNAVSGVSFYLRSTGGATTYLRTNITFSSARPSLSISKGLQSGHVVRWVNGWYRFALQTTANLSTGPYRVGCDPAQGAAANKGNVLVFGPQVEH